MDVSKILQHFHIGYVEAPHVNVSPSCFGINCPYCGDNNLYHLGIFKQTGNFTCWKCKTSGSLYKLINEIKNISWEEFQRVSGISKNSYNGDSSKEILDNIFKKEEKKMEKVVEPIKLQYTKPAWEDTNCLNFCKKRGFSLFDLDRYGCLYTHAGKYKQRLIIPIPPPFMKTTRNRYEGFTARDITGIAKSKYIFPKGFKAHNFIYPTMGCWKRKYPNGDISTPFVIVEGVFDAWSLADFAVGIAIFGRTLSSAQLNKLLNYIPNRNCKVIVCLDGDAKAQNFVLRNKLAPFFRNVETIYLEGKEDPASMDRKTLKKLILKKEK